MRGRTTWDDVVAFAAARGFEALEVCNGDRLSAVARIRLRCILCGKTVVQRLYNILRRAHLPPRGGWLARIRPC